MVGERESESNSFERKSITLMVHSEKKIFGVGERIFGRGGHTFLVVCPNQTALYRELCVSKCVQPMDTPLS